MKAKRAKNPLRVYDVLLVLIALAFLSLLGLGARAREPAEPFVTEHMVAAAYSHSLALRSDGTVWAWGHNYDGQLGDGSNTDRSVPVQVLNLSEVVAISAGGACGMSQSGATGHSLALKADGTVWAWGNKASFTFPPISNNSTPVQVPGLNDVSAVAAGSGHSLALKNDGTVWEWGSSPVQVNGLDSVMAISAGEQISVALKIDGTVWTWEDGQPEQRMGLSDVVAISAGSSYFLALKSDSTIWRGWAWGEPKTSHQIADIEGIIAIAASANQDIALKNDGTIWALDSTPFKVGGLSGITNIAASSRVGESGTYHSLAVKSDGTVWAWGRNDFGQLGNGSAASYSTVTVPAQVRDLNLGAQYALSVDSDSGGTASANKAIAPAGLQITLTATPDEGKMFDRWTAVGGGSFLDANSATTTFAMPANAATVTAVFKDVPPEKSELAALLAQARAIAKGNNTDATWNALQAAIVSAQAVLDDEDAAQGQVNAQVAALQAAIDGLAEKPTPVDKAALDALIELANGIPRNPYTAITWNALQAAIHNARAVANNANATQAQVDAQVAALQSAMDGLEANPPPKTIFRTRYEATTRNWLLFIFLFGWIWMWL